MKKRRLLSSSLCELIDLEKDSMEKQEDKDMQTKGKHQNVDDGWKHLKKRRNTDMLEDSADPKTGDSDNRTLLDLLLADCSNAWKTDSEFLKVAAGMLVSVQRGQDFKVRSAAHQCLGSLINKKIAKLPIRFTDRIEWGLSNGLLTQTQADHLRTLRHAECLH